MRKVNTLCISEEKSICCTVGVEYQLGTSKTGVCLDQNWMFVDRREEGGADPKLRLFCGRINE